VDARHYPDPAYQSLCGALADFHGVDASRVVLAASASEFIMRLTASLARQGRTKVWLPEFAYGEYAHAAQVWGFERVAQPAQSHLSWLCEPSSPLGQVEAHAQQVVEQGDVVVLDRAYEPLRLAGQSSLNESALSRTWQLYSPNKALGLTGIRGAYAIAPVHELSLVAEVMAQAPSWPLGSHAVVMLTAWTQADVQAWLADSRDTLRVWKEAQLKLLSPLDCLSSDTNFLCVRADMDAEYLRLQGIKLRDATSFGLPGHWRLSVQPPQAQQALLSALKVKGSV
jgi:histidinol-phosphate aminotransferase